MKKSTFTIAAILLSGAILTGCNADSLGNKILTFFIGHKETRKEVVQRVDKDQDGKVSADELAMSGLDTNHDGILQREEIDAGKQETEGSPWSDALLWLLGLAIPGAGAVAARTIVAQRGHLRGAIASFEDIKDQITAGKKIESWDDVKGIIAANVPDHTDPQAFHRLVQKVTAQING